MTIFKKSGIAYRGNIWMKMLILCFFIIGNARYASAQAVAQKPVRILFLLDASSSMLDNWTDKESRFKAASRIISTIADSIQNINSEAAFAVRVFGSQYPAQEQNCFDSRLEVSFNNGNASQVRTRLKYLSPRGYSPIAWSLRETAEGDFKESNQYAYSIILITDGGESCGGDICATAKQLLEQKISFKPYILSLVDYEPLRLQYDCLGKYLLVGQEKDIKPAISTIINDNRPILSVKSSGLRTVNTERPPARSIGQIPVTEKKEGSSPAIEKEPVSDIEKNKDREPEVVKEERKETPTPQPPAALPRPQPINRITGIKNLRKTATLPAAKKATPVKVPRLVVNLIEEPEPPASLPKSQPVNRIAGIKKPGKLATFPSVTKGSPVKVPRLIVKIIEEPEPFVPPNPQSANRIASVKNPRRLNLLYALPEAVSVKVPRLIVRLPLEPEQQPSTPTTTVSRQQPERRNTVNPVKPSNTVSPKPPSAKEEENLEFTIKNEEAKESTLQVYFTNGQGRFYSTEPRMVIRDNKTQKEIKNVYRNVTGGEPDPIKLPPGTYDIAIPGGNGKAANVVIEPNANKKVYIKVNRGALAFYHPTAPDKPVKQYMAFVSKRFEPGPVVKQRCDEELPYDPANYHIEINTLPKLIYNIDLDFNSVKLVEIPEPGTIQISNLNTMGKVQFWNQRGDAFVPFHEMNVTGDVAAQKREFLPGIYQVRYFKTPMQPNQKAEVVVFSIKSNQTTVIELSN